MNLGSMKQAISVAKFIATIGAHEEEEQAA